MQKEFQVVGSWGVIPPTGLVLEQIQQGLTRSRGQVDWRLSGQSSIIVSDKDTENYPLPQFLTSYLESRKWRQWDHLKMVKIIKVAYVQSAHGEQIPRNWNKPSRREKKSSPGMEVNKLGVSEKAEPCNIPKAPPSPICNCRSSREESPRPDALPAGCTVPEMQRLGVVTRVGWGFQGCTCFWVILTVSVISHSYLLITPIKTHWFPRLGFHSIVTLVCVHSLFLRGEGGGGS